MSVLGSRSSFLTHKAVSIPALSTMNLAISGQIFVCKEAEAEFQLALDNGEFFPMDIGLGIRLNGDDYFSAIRLKNTSASAVSIEFYAGNGQVFDTRAVTPVSSIVNVSGSMINNLADCVASSPDQFVKNVASAGTAEALKGSSYYVRKAIVYAYKDAARTANIGNVYLGGSGSGTDQPIVIAPGQEYVIEPSVGNKSDLVGWYLNADNDGDGVVVIRVA